MGRYYMACREKVLPKEQPDRVDRTTRARERGITTITGRNGLLAVKGQQCELDRIAKSSQCGLSKLNRSKDLQVPSVEGSSSVRATKRQHRP